MSKAPVLYFVFDVMVLAGREVMREPLEVRRELLEKKILPRVGEPVRYAAPLHASLAVVIESVKVQTARREVQSHPWLTRSE